MAGRGNVTIDHDEIRRWADERQAKPATVRGTAEDGPGVLRIMFPGTKPGRLDEITWSEFFEKFESKRLAFLYQDRTRSGELSRFFKFVARERIGSTGESRGRAA